jgi:hypothetical protein
MKKSVVSAGVAFSLLAATGCGGGSDSPPPVGGINGPAIVDPDVEIDSVDNSDG